MSTYDRLLEQGCYDGISMLTYVIAERRILELAVEGQLRNLQLKPIMDASLEEALSCLEGPEGPTANHK